MGNTCVSLAKEKNDRYFLHTVLIVRKRTTCSSWERGKKSRAKAKDKPINQIGIKDVYPRKIKDVKGKYTGNYVYKGA